MYTISIYSNGSGDVAFIEETRAEAEQKARDLLTEITEQKTSIGTYEYSAGTEIVIEDEESNTIDKFIVNRSTP